MERVRELMNELCAMLVEDYVKKMEDLERYCQRDRRVGNIHLESPEENIEMEVSRSNLGAVHDYYDTERLVIITQRGLGTHYFSIKYKEGAEAVWPNPKIEIEFLYNIGPRVTHVLLDLMALGEKNYHEGWERWNENFSNEEIQVGFLLYTIEFMRWIRRLLDMHIAQKIARYDRNQKRDISNRFTSTRRQAGKF